jgi:glutathione S-transferase
LIILHHLAFSRSLRVLWLLEELGLDFELVSYERTMEFRAPPELARVHPLGKAPVIVDNGLVLAESATILRYIHDRHGHGSLTPPAGSNAHALHEEWLDYVESSAGLPIMMTMLGARMGGLSDGIKVFAESQTSKTLDYISAAIGEGPFLMGEQLTLADIQMSYMLVVAEMAGILAPYPAIAAYLDRLKRQPGFQRTVARGGPMAPPAA